MLMPHLLRFSRNRTTSVERVDEETIRASCWLGDTLMEARLEITVRLPDLDISAIQSHISRDERGGCLGSMDALDKAIGVRIGPGMTKILQGLVGEDFPCPQLLFMVEECCHGIILYFTKDELEGVPDDPEGSRQFFARMVRKNIRLYNRCISFSPTSPITRGIEPPSKDAS
ncbi:MAG: hypothetical protein PVG49_13015 [Desulfobacteraceae bacterium]|jgi:hypothetical protein